MDRLPPSLQLEILNRLNESTDLARCRLVSKTLDNLSYDVSSLNIICSHDRYLKSRSPETQSHITPFKSIVRKFLLSLKNLENISIGVEKAWREISMIDNLEADDLFFMDDDFVSEWLPEIGGRLKSISITNFQIQARRSDRASKILNLISSHCNHLVELKLKNVFLLLEGLQPMLMLKNLTLESLMLRENGLDKVKEFFPSLRVLNLISVGGLIGPKIHLLHLKTCQWCIFDDQPSLTIQTPMLMDLELKFGEIQTLILKAPLLSALYLSMTKASEVFEVEEFNNLKSLHIESRDLCNLIKLFPECNIVEKLVLDSPNWVDLRPTVKENVSFEKLMSKFPNVSDLSLRPGAWVKLEKSFLGGGLEAVNGWKTLKQLMAHLVVYDVETTRHFISSILERFPTLSEMKMLVHRGVASDVRSHLISSCMADCPRIKWRWGKWSLGQNDTWVSDGI